MEAMYNLKSQAAIEYIPYKTASYVHEAIQVVQWTRSLRDHAKILHLALEASPIRAVLYSNNAQ